MYRAILLFVLSFANAAAFADTPTKLQFLFSADAHAQDATLTQIDLTKFDRYMCLPALAGCQYLGKTYAGSDVTLTLGEQTYKLASQVEIAWPDYVGSTHHEFYFLDDERDCLAEPMGSDERYMSRMVLAFRNEMFPSSYIWLELRLKDKVALLRDGSSRNVIAHGRFN